MSADVERLREIAEAARYDGQHWYTEEEFVGRWPECCDCGCPVAMGANRKVEAYHIATFDPPMILALLDRLREAEAAVERVRALADRWERQTPKPRTLGYADAYKDDLRAALTGAQDADDRWDD